MKTIFALFLITLSAFSQVTIPAGTTDLFGPTNSPDILFTNSNNHSVTVAIYDCDWLLFEGRAITNRSTTIVPIGSNSVPVVTVTTNYPGLVERQRIPAMSCGTFPARTWKRGCIVVSSGEISGGFSNSK